MTATSDPSKNAVTTAAAKGAGGVPGTVGVVDPVRRTHQLARLVLGAFVFTFLIARILVIVIMSRKLPEQLFLHVQGTHVHHLNYGIFMLSIVGGYLVFVRPQGKLLSTAAVFYGIGLALTFDEFGMWLHLGGYYWQRASYDAVIVIAAVLALVAYGSTIRHWHPRHHITIVALVILLGVLGFGMYYGQTWAREAALPALQQMEERGPT